MKPFRYESLPPCDGRKPAAALLFFHGYGGAVSDALPVLNIMAEELPRWGFFSIEAPDPCESGGGYQWFSLRTYDPSLLDTRFDEEGTAAFRNEALQGLLDKQDRLHHTIGHIAQAEALPLDRLILCGFSQGGILVLETLIRLRTPFLAAVCLSGLLLSGQPAVQSLTAEGAQTPLGIFYGEQDGIIRPQAVRRAVQSLKEAGKSADVFNYPSMDHTIDMNELADIVTFLKATARLPRKPA